MAFSFLIPLIVVVPRRPRDNLPMTLVTAAPELHLSRQKGGSQGCEATDFDLNRDSTGTYTRSD